MPLLTYQGSHLDYLVTGSGAPVTVFGHGLAGSIAETRPFGSGVPGTKAYLHFRGHGASHAPETDWTYPALAGELAAVADHVGATRALGVSMGAGALLALLAGEPQRFDRVVLVLPAALDRPRADSAVRRLDAAARCVEDRDLEGLTAVLLDEQPAAARDRPDVVAWVRERARRILGTPVSRALRHLPGEVPLADRSVLAAVTVPVLVLAQAGDDAHPVDVAEQTAAAFPRATLEVLPPGGVLWTHRARVRELVSGFLAA